MIRRPATRATGRPAAPARRAAARRALVVLVAVPVLAGWSFLDPFHARVETGNREAAQGEDAAALEAYGEAAKLRPSSPVPDFNRGLVLSRGDDHAAARDAFLGAAAAEDSVIAADALYNLGNLHFDDQEWEPAIDAYLKSLDLDPDDADARRNLELAVQRLQEQQQQQQQQQEQQPQPQDSDDQGDEPQQEQPPPEDQPQEGQDESPSPDESEESPPQPEPRPEERLTREDAERLLNAIASEELKVLEEQRPEEDAGQGVVSHDW